MSQKLISGRSNLLAYTLNDGTLGVYDETVRLWRIKSKARGTALTSYDLLGTGTYQLIIGWESGKVNSYKYCQEYSSLIFTCKPIG